MNIPIRIPQWLVHVWNVFSEWGNTCVWQRYPDNINPNWKDDTRQYEIRRLDILLAALFVFSTAWYGYYYGVWGALQGSISFAVIAALALFMRR